MRIKVLMKLIKERNYNQKKGIKRKHNRDYFVPKNIIF